MTFEKKHSPIRWQRATSKNKHEMGQKDRKRHRQSDKFRRRMTVLEDLFFD
jgi:hypothetical protein